MNTDLADLNLINKLIYFQSRHDNLQVEQLLRPLSNSDKKNLLHQARLQLAPAKSGVNQEIFAHHSLKTIRINGLNFVLDKIGQSQLRSLLTLYNQNLCVGICDVLADKGAYLQHAQKYAQEQVTRLFTCPSVNPCGIPKLTTETTLHPNLQIVFEHIEHKKHRVYSLKLNEFVVGVTNTFDRNINDIVTMKLPPLSDISDNGIVCQGKVTSIKQTTSRDCLLVTIKLSPKRAVINQLLRYIRVNYDRFPMSKQQEVEKATALLLQSQVITSQSLVVPIICQQKNNKYIPKYLFHTRGNFVTANSFVHNGEFTFDQQTFDSLVSNYQQQQFVVCAKNHQGMPLMMPSTAPQAGELIQYGINNDTLAFYMFEFRPVSDSHLVRARALCDGHQEASDQVNDVSAIAYLTAIPLNFEQQQVCVEPTPSTLFEQSRSSYPLTTLLTETHDRRKETRFALDITAQIKTGPFSSQQVQILDISASGASIQFPSELGRLQNKSSVTLKIPKLKSVNVPFNVVSVDSVRHIMHLTLNQQRRVGKQFYSFLKQVIESNKSYFKPRDLLLKTEQLYLPMLSLISAYNPHITLRSVKHNGPVESLEQCFYSQAGHDQDINPLLTLTPSGEQLFNGDLFKSPSLHGSNEWLSLITSQSNQAQLVSYHLNSADGIAENIDFSHQEYDDSAAFLLVLASVPEHTDELIINTHSRHINTNSKIKALELTAALRQTKHIITVKDISFLINYLIPLGISVKLFPNNQKQNQDKKSRVS